MIYKKDFRFLKYIYPKADDITLKKLTILSNAIEGYEKENFMYSGAATIEGCEDCGKLLISELYYEQNGLNVDHLFSINIEIEKQLPFFVSAITISDTLFTLPPVVAIDLKNKNIRPYPPISEVHQDCFGGESHYGIVFDKDTMPYIEANGYQYDLMNKPEFVTAAQKMSLPVKARWFLPPPGIPDSLNIDKDFARLNNIEELTLVVRAPTDFPFFLIGNKKIKALDILLTKNAGNFLIPDAILSMDDLKVLSFRGEGVVVLPKVLFDPVKRAATKIKLSQKPESKVLFISQ